MKRMLTALILISAAANAFADSFNYVNIQGRLESASPITNVSVDILSGGQVVGSGSAVDLIPDTTTFVFSTQTYISDPKVFLSGAGYDLRLSSPDATVLGTFPIHAVPFALTVRGDKDTGDQNVFGAYGNIGVGSGTPSYRLTISSGSGYSGKLLVISTGTSEVIQMTGAGEIYAKKYYGDGSSLTGVVGGGDNLGNHIATTSLSMAGFNINAVGTINATGDISAARYQISGSTVLAVFPGYDSLAVGVDAGRINAGSRNLFVGSSAGYSNNSGALNTFVGPFAGYSNTWGNHNTFLGESAGENNTSGSYNTILGENAGNHNTTGSYNTFVGDWTALNNGSASENTIVGAFAGYFNTGGDNTFLGYLAGYSNTSGSSNIVIGDGQDLSSPTAANELNIGGTIWGNLAARTIGIGMQPQQAALDVVSTGTASNQFAQIWRDSTGVIKSSISATGVLMANKFIGDGSALTGISGDNLGNHTATQALDMANNQILNVSSLTITGKDASGYSLSLSSGINMPNGTVSAGSFIGTGAALTSLNASNLTTGTISDSRLSTNVNLLTANQTVTGINTFTSSMTLTNPAFSIGGSTLVVTGGNVGIGTTNPDEKLHVAGGNLAVQTDGIADKILKFKQGGITDTTGRSMLTTSWDGASYWMLKLGTVGYDPTMTLKAGNVGIGTTNPSETLDIIGGIKTSNGIKVDDAAGQAYLNYYATATVTMNYSGMTTNPTTTAYCTRVGNMVTIVVAAGAFLTKNGSNGPMTIATIPAQFRPSATLSWIMPMNIGGIGESSFVSIISAGNINIYATKAGANIAANTTPVALQADMTFTYVIF